MENSRSLSTLLQISKQQIHSSFHSLIQIQGLKGKHINITVEAVRKDPLHGGNT